MPNRVVREAILRSDKVNSLSWSCECFYRRLMSVADDYGRFDGRPSIIRSSIFPLKINQVSEADIVKWSDECSAAGLVSFYEVDNKAYLEIIDFSQTVRIKKEKYPPASRCKQMQADVLHMSAETKPNQTEKNPKQEIETKVVKNILETYFNDLPNSSEMEAISMDLRIPKEQLIKRIPDFRRSAELEYQSFQKLCVHFKRWIDKNRVAPPTNTNEFKTGKKK